MSRITKNELKALLTTPQGPTVSIFMPTHQSGPETQQDPIRLKNLLDTAEERLNNMELRTPDIRSLLQPAHNLLEDRLFWQHQRSGLAIFLSQDFERTYRLPLELEELVVVGDRFHLKPLLALLSGQGKFYILGLSQNQIRLLEGTRDQINEVNLQEEIPESLAEALRFDVFVSQQQFHTGTSGGQGDRSAIYHGHGAGEDDKKTNILRFFQQLDRGLQTVLQEEQAPLLLAGVEYLLPIYREANSYPHLLEGGLTGNPEDLSAKEIHERAWEIVEPQFQQAEMEARADYQRLAHTEQATDRIRDILMAAHQGRIESLFVALGHQQWGAYEFTTNNLTLHSQPQPNDEDLFDTAAIQTLLHSGAVYAVQPDNMPTEASIAAVFRY